MKRSTDVRSLDPDFRLHDKIAKIMSLIMLNSYERDLLMRLLNVHAESEFLWKSQLQYDLVEEDSGIRIKVSNLNHNKSIFHKTNCNHESINH